MAPKLIEGPDNRGIGGAALALNGSGLGVSFDKVLNELAPLIFLSDLNTANAKKTGASQKSWRRLDGHNQLPKLIQGVRFSDGIEVAANLASSQSQTAVA